MARHRDCGAVLLSPCGAPHIAGVERTKRQRDAIRGVLEETPRPLVYLFGAGWVALVADLEKRL